MQLKVLQQSFRNSLKEIYPTSEIDTFFFWLLEERLQMTKTDFFVKSEVSLSQDDLAYFENALHQLQEEKPIQYILRKAEFFGMEFQVNGHTLIPRPETEELVRWIIEEHADKKESELGIFEIGSGSGCIPISLATFFTNASIRSIDVSEAAIQTAQKNAQLNQVNVEFLLKDVLQLEKIEWKVDILVSNPPYVKKNEKHMMKKNVLAYEPHTALFVEDDDALIFYRKIFQLAKQHQIAFTYLEINEFLAKETLELAEEFQPTSALLKKDMFGKQRMLKVCF